jgi:peptidoglycan/xylan/chitin deacetylase (PgdA/CDA1 family)
MSHDVDWRKQGASIEHIFTRKERFEKETLEMASIKNPYYNIPDIMNLEEKFGMRSTFFFRTMYEDGDYTDYEDDIRTLVKGNWEIGLHSEPSSIYDIHSISKEKTKLENLSKTVLLGNRAHYLAFDEQFPSKLQKVGFAYDSSVKKFRSSIDIRDTGYYRHDKLIEFPITLMDAYLFAFMNVKEEQVINIFEQTIKDIKSTEQDFKIVTVLWHDNVLKMKGGRMYAKILEFLTSQEDTKITRGIDLCEAINKNEFR